jgi:hypothetical protein
MRISQMTHAKQWGVLPPSSFIIQHEGLEAGFGTHPVWDAVPGAWNILNLVVDLLAITRGLPPGEYPHALSIVPLVVATAMQMYEAPTTLGDLTLLVSPREWLDRLGKHEHAERFILPLILGGTFRSLAEEGVARLALSGCNVVYADFANKKVKTVH